MMAHNSEEKIITQEHLRKRERERNTHTHCQIDLSSLKAERSEKDLMSSRSSNALSLRPKLDASVLKDHGCFISNKYIIHLF